jgi:hypothetical protein
VDRVLGMAPRHTWAMQARARFLLTLSLPGPAEAAARAAVELAPDDWQAHANLAEVLTARGGTRRIVAARRCADTVRELAPNEPATHVLDARVHIRMARFAPAQQALHRALALDPQHESALQHLALLDAVRDRVQAAARGFTEALDVSPTDATVGQVHTAVAQGVLWQLSDAMALATFAHWALFAALDDNLGGSHRPARLVAAGLTLLAFGWLSFRTWSRQPQAVRRRLRLAARGSSVLLCVLLTAAMAAAMMINGFDPPVEGPSGGIRALDRPNTRDAPPARASASDGGRTPTDARP